MSVTDQSLPDWLTSHWRHVAKLRKADRLPHGLLVSGPAGVGKHIFANKLAQLLLCNTPDADRPCGGCKACRLYVAQTHADLRVLQPEEGGKVIKVDAVRALSDFLNQSATIGKDKVAIIHPAEALNINASNALLKTLEEPSAHSTLILVTNSTGDLLPTIRSRCQRIDVKQPAQELALAWLSKQGSDEFVDSNALESVLALAGGAPMKAKAYLDAKVVDELVTMQAQLASMMRQELAIAELSGSWADDSLGERLVWLLHWVEQLIRESLATDRLWLEQQPAKKMFRYLVENNQVESFYSLRQVHLKALAQYRSGANPNASLLCESLLGNWLNLMKKKRNA